MLHIAFRNSSVSKFRSFGSITAETHPIAPFASTLETLSNDIKNAISVAYAKMPLFAWTVTYNVVCIYILVVCTSYLLVVCTSCMY